VTGALRENSVNFDALEAAPAELERVYRERLSYHAVYAKRGEPTPSPKPSGNRYAKVILYLASNGVLAKFDEAVAQVRRTYDQEMARLRFQSSDWGNDDSWINWDLAKQLYFFAGVKRPETGHRYRIADPLADERLRDEIVSRQIGWEACGSGDYGPWATNPDVTELFAPEYGSSSKKGQRASWVLAKLGVIRRSQVWQ
jgi:hypothetical protein